MGNTKNTKNTKYLFHRISDWTPTRSLNKRTLMNWKFNRMWLTRDRFHMIFNLIQLVSGSVPRLQIETPKSDTRSLTMRFLKTVRSNSTWFKNELHIFKSLWTLRYVFVLNQVVQWNQKVFQHYHSIVLFLLLYIALIQWSTKEIHTVNYHSQKPS